MRRYHSHRRGVAVTEWVVIAALIVIGLVSGVALLGTRTNNKLGQTASDMANPQSLTTRFKK
jgi:Flp pilus assembly pilin Flp